MGSIHRKNSKGADCSLSPAASEASARSGGSRGSRARSRSRSGSITSHRSHRSGSTYSWTTKDDNESISESEPSHAKKDAPHDNEHAEIREGNGEVLGDSQAASNGEDGPGGSPTQNTHSGVSHVFGTHEETDGESVHEEGTPPKRQKWCQPSPKEEVSSHESEELFSSKEEQLTDKALHDRCQQQARRMNTDFDARQSKKITKGLPGWATRDTMICDLPKHGKAQPNHPDPIGPPLEYMHDHKAFEGISSDLYDLCQFYTLGTTGDPPEFPAPQEPTTCGQIRDLLKLACAIGRPYLIMAHSADSVTAISLLRELHTTACLWQLQVDLRDKSVKLSFCPFCAYAGGGGMTSPT